MSRSQYHGSGITVTVSRPRCPGHGSRSRCPGHGVPVTVSRSRCHRDGHGDTVTVLRYGITVTVSRCHGVTVSRCHRFGVAVLLVGFHPRTLRHWEALRPAGAWRFPARFVLSPLKQSGGPKPHSPTMDPSAGSTGSRSRRTTVTAYHWRAPGLAQANPKLEPHSRLLQLRRIRVTVIRCSGSPSRSRSGGAAGLGPLLAARRRARIAAQAIPAGGGLGGTVTARADAAPSE